MNLTVSQRVARITAWILAIAMAAAAGGCVKVRPSAYELGLKAYYGALLSETSEASLTQAISALNDELRKSPSDPGLLALRASGRLELLRLGVQKQDGVFGTADAGSLFKDLRLLRNLVDQGVAKPWIRARVSTMAADAFLLRAESLPQQSEANPILLRSIRRAALFQLARDFYQHAWAAATAEESAQQGDDEGAAANRVAIEQEKGNARDGYVNALVGFAQTRRVLGFEQQARALNVQAIGLLTAVNAPLPAADARLTPKSLYAYTHRLLQTQYGSMENLTNDNFAERIGYAESALKEQFAAKLLISDPEDVSRGDEEAVGRLLSYYAAMEAWTESVKVEGAGNLGAESLAFKLFPGRQYAAAQVSADPLYLTLVIGEGSSAARQRLAVPRGFAVLPGGVQVTIHSRAGQNSTEFDEQLTFFLGRSQALLGTGAAPVQILGPADDLLAQFP